MAGDLDSSNDRAYLDAHASDAEKQKWTDEAAAAKKAAAAAQSQAQINAILAALQQQNDYLRDIRENQDAANPNPPTRAH